MHTIIRSRGAPYWGLSFNGLSSLVDCANHASLTDLCAAGQVFQVEGWIKNSTTLGVVVSKGYRNGLGWTVYVDAGNIKTDVELATTVIKDVAVMPGVNIWFHFVSAYDDAAKKGRMAVNGSWGAEKIGAGDYISDAAHSLFIGIQDDVSALHQHFTGCIAWLRIHNHAHYTPGTSFTPPSKTFPGIDAGTVEAWVMDAGSGDLLVSEVNTPINDGTLTACTWIKWA